MEPRSRSLPVSSPLRALPRAGSLWVLLAALSGFSPTTLPGQDQVRAGSRDVVRAADSDDGGRASSASSSRSSSYCRAVHSWLEVDGRVGEVRLTRDGRRALVGYTEDTGMGAAGRTFLRIVDLATGRTTVTADLGPFGRITDIWPSHEGTRVWIAAEQGGRVLTVDSRTGELLMIWVIGQTSSQAGTVSRRDRYLYVTNRAAGTLTLINRATVGARTVEIGRGVSSVDVWERGARTVWLANQITDELVAVSGRDGAIIARMGSGGRDPVHLRVRPGTDELWVVHRGSRDAVVVDSRDREILDRIPLDGAPRALTFSADGKEAYVTLPDGDRVLHIDAGSRQVIRSVPAADASPELAMAGCAAADAVACSAEGRDPWTDASGLPVDWVDDQQIVYGRMCGFPAPDREISGPS